MRLALGVAASVALGFVGCNAPAKVPAVVVINETFHQPFDLDPPQILNVRMNLGGTLEEIRARCDNMGGHDLVKRNQYVRYYICEEVDY